MGGNLLLFSLIFSIYFALASSSPAGELDKGHTGNEKNSSGVKSGTSSYYLLCGSINQVVPDTKYFFKSYPYAEGYGSKGRHDDGKMHKREAGKAKTHGSEPEEAEMLEEATFMEDSLYLERSRRYAAKNNRANCMISFVRKGDCRLVLHFSYFYPGEQSCYKQYALITDEEYAYQICGFRSPPREYESMTSTLVMTHFRRENVRLHSFEGYVICHSNLTDPNHGAAIYIPAVVVEQEPSPYSLSGYGAKHAPDVGGVNGMGNFKVPSMQGYPNVGMYNRFPSMYGGYHHEVPGNSFSTVPNPKITTTTTSPPSTYTVKVINHNNPPPNTKQGKTDPTTTTTSPPSTYMVKVINHNNPPPNTMQGKTGPTTTTTTTSAPSTYMVKVINHNNPPPNTMQGKTDPTTTTTTSPPSTSMVKVINYNNPSPNTMYGKTNPTTTTTPRPHWPSTGGNTGGILSTPTPATMIPVPAHFEYNGENYGMGGNAGYGKYGGNAGYQGMGGYNGYGVPVFYGPPMMPMGGYYGYAPATSYYGSKNTNYRVLGANNGGSNRFAVAGNANSGGLGSDSEKNSQNHKEGIHHGEKEQHAQGGSDGGNHGKIVDEPKHTSFDYVYKYQVDTVGEEAMPYENPRAGVVKFSQDWPPE